MILGRRPPHPFRWFLLCVLVIGAALSQAQNALILIQHDHAGPFLPSADYVLGEWIRWPADQSFGNNRMLALASGLDLKGELSDTEFKSRADGEWLSGNAKSLEARGFFEARDNHLGGVAATIVSKHPGRISPNLLLLALSSPSATVRDQPLPRDGLVLYEAESWDEALKLASEVSGRTLIVEYPPEVGQGWSRYWLRGHWPPGDPVERDLGVPGLVRAREALTLLLRPQTFVWRATDVGRWGGANRWLEHGRSTTPIVLAVWTVAALFVIAWGLAQVMNEDRGPFVSELLILVGLSPAALVLAGAMERFGGLEEWPLWLTLATIGLYGVSSVGSLAARRFLPEAHPLWVPCLVGLATMAAFNPLWSDLSGRFGLMDLDVPGDALGAFVAYLTGAAAFAKGRWFGRATVGAVLLWGVTAHPWWVDAHPGLLIPPALTLIAAEGLFRPGLLIALVLLPTGWLRIFRDGVAWNPGGLLEAADERNALNLWETTAFVISPQWLGALGFFSILGVVGNRFLAYRLRKLLRLDPRLRALPWVALGTLALGVTEPLTLPAAPVVVLGALISLAYDGLRANT